MSAKLIVSKHSDPELARYHIVSTRFNSKYVEIGSKIYMNKTDVDISDFIQLGSESRMHSQLILNERIDVTPFELTDTTNLIDIEVLNKSQDNIIELNDDMLLDILDSQPIHEPRTYQINSKLKIIVSANKLGKVCKGITKINYKSLTNVTIKGMTKNMFKINSVDFQSMGIGGLNRELEELITQIIVPRMYPEDILKDVKYKHAKGIILHGPPGCGKTLIARKLGELLNVKTVKLVNGPELLNKFVGETERNIRELFADAENDKLNLHLIIFDEIDALTRTRKASSGESGVNCVNQLLTKIDGVNEINNIIIIGLTNRLDIIDPALLRTGRFEIKLLIPLPSEEGRREIFKIYIDNIPKINIPIELNPLIDRLTKLTVGFSGSDVESTIRNAISRSMSRNVDMKSMKLINPSFELTCEDFELAVEAISNSKFINRYPIEKMKNIYGCNGEELSMTDEFQRVSVSKIASINKFIDEMRGFKTLYISSVEELDLPELDICSNIKNIFKQTEAGNSILIIHGYENLVCAGNRIRLLMDSLISHKTEFKRIIIALD